MMTSVNRRDFMKVAGTAGAGLVLSFYLPSNNKLFGESEAESFAPNVWLTIDAKGIVTITSAKTEMGQGARTYFPDHGRRRIGSRLEIYKSCTGRCRSHQIREPGNGWKHGSPHVVGQIA